jgi:hypothetical protein
LGEVEDAEFLPASVPVSGGRDDIGPRLQIGSSVPGKKAWNLHETFTAIARDCVTAARPNLPRNCVQLFPQIRERTRQEQDQSNVEAYSARWPDDPTRMLDGSRGKIRFGLQFLRECRDALERGPAIDRVGLLCSSHFGRLQFLHAQASAEDRNDPARTRDRILAWAMFAYRAATDPSFRRTNYCDAVAAWPDANLRTSLSFSDRTFCTDRPRFPAWTVGTMFGLRCSSLLSDTCRLQTGEEGEARAEQGARGAVLHVIQDSFSQSHVARVPRGRLASGPRGPFEARVVCRPPVYFFDYLIQNLPTPNDLGQMPDEPHAVADQRPVLDDSCSEPNHATDDVLTATAVALYYLDRPDPARFRAYLETRVFPVGWSRT